MSRLSIDHLEIFFSPTAVELVRMHGLWRSKVVERLCLDCVAESSMAGWHNALAVLHEAMGDPRWQNLPITITLSDRIVRYQLLPWLPELRSATESAGYARFHFRQVYGNLADEWDIRVDETTEGMPSLACATDIALMTSLKELAISSGGKLRHVLPRFAAIFNRLYRFLKISEGEIFIFALVEAGALTLAVLEGRCWKSVRQRFIVTTPAETLSDALQQECLLASPPLGKTKVYLAAPPAGNGEYSSLLDAQWILKRLDMPYNIPQPGRPA